VDSTGGGRDNLPLTASAPPAKGIAQMVPSQYQRLHAWVWTREPRSAWGRRAVHVARYALALVRDLIEGDISLRAMSLVYTTLLSLVPALALAFSLLKALGVHNSLQPLLLRLLEPLGEQARTVADSVIGFVDNIKVGVLGSVGVVMLLYTAVSVISKIETSFNFIWRVGHTRGMTQRFSEYLVVLLVGPVVVFSALALTGSLRNSAVVTWLATIEPFGTAIIVLTKAVPYLLLVGVFTFMYVFIPNTRVRIGPAVIGGVFAGVAWQSASAAFAAFVATSPQRSAIYSGFAIVLVLLVWLYVGWMIVLFGCRLAFYVQHPRFLAHVSEPAPPGSREAEFLALRVVALVGERFIAGAVPLGVEQLERELPAPRERLDWVLSTLLRQNLLAETGSERHLLPARDPASYSLADLWLLVRGDAADFRRHDAQGQRIAEFLREAEAQAARVGAQSVRDWLCQSQAAEGQPCHTRRG
jgi:membrane protein